MAKTRPQKSKDPKRSGTKDVPSAASPAKAMDPTTLLDKATALLQTGQPAAALPLAQKALAALSSANGTSSASLLPALSVLGEIQIELGDRDSALSVFQTAISIDPEGSVPGLEDGGAEKFLWMAQLNEAGGTESVRWFEKGVTVLEREIAELEGGNGREDELELRKRKLVGALCGIIEVWMTDLSFQEEAESKCESLITRALLVLPQPDYQTLQTLASIRLSQSRLEDAQSALERSLDLWQDLPPEHPLVPDFPTRISLARLLMEAEMEDVALEVLERLVGEDDQSVEAWYLGGWCQWLMGQHDEDDDGKEAMKEEEADPFQEERKILLMSSREWLRNCLKLYEALQYDDDRLRDHATELVGALDKDLGSAEIEDDDEWEGADSDYDSEDQEMIGT